MKRGKLFILHHDVQRHKKAKPAPDRLAEARMVQSGQVRSGYFDDLKAIELSCNEQPTIPVLPNSPDYSQAKDGLHEVKQLEITDITDGFSDFMDSAFEDQFDEFFNENLEEINHSPQASSEQSTAPPKQKKQPVYSQPKAETVPVDYSDPHHLFDQIGNNIAKTKAISLGEFSIETSDNASTPPPLMGEDELNEDLNLLNNTKKHSDEK
jgi:hypothetical protein